MVDFFFICLIRLVLAWIRLLSKIYNLLIGYLLAWNHCDGKIQARVLTRLGWNWTVIYYVWYEGVNASTSLRALAKHMMPVLSFPPLFPVCICLIMLLITDLQPHQRDGAELVQILIKTVLRREKFKDGLLCSNRSRSCTNWWHSISLQRLFSRSSHSQKRSPQ